MNCMVMVSKEKGSLLKVMAICKEKVIYKETAKGSYKEMGFYKETAKGSYKEMGFYKATDS